MSTTPKMNITLRLIKLAADAQE